MLPDVQLCVYTVLLCFRTCYLFNLDQGYGLKLCRRMCQQRGCCLESCDEKRLKCLPNTKYPILMEAGSPEQATCTILTRSFQTRTREEHVVTDCAMGYSEYILTHYNIHKHLRISNDVDKSLRGSIGLGYLEIVDLLVQHGAHLTIKDFNNNSMLAVACYSRSSEMIEYILSKKCVAVDTRGKDGATSFLEAACLGTVDMMEILIKNGCNTSEVDNTGHNVLHYGSASQNLDNIVFILKNRFIKDINSRTNNGLTALLIAADFNNTEVFDFLVSSGTDVSAVDEKKRNILHWACFDGNISMVSHILQLSEERVKNLPYPSVNSRDEGGRTPLFEAALSGFVDIIDLLVSHGSDTHTAYDDGDTILHETVRRGRIDAVQHITAKHYVSVESRGQYGYTPILTAAFYGQIQIFKYLVNINCNKEAIDDYHDNIFHLACCGGHVTLVKYIHEKGYISRLELRDWNNWTQVLLASFGGHQEVVEYLLELGCDMCAVDKEGDNALHLTILNGHRKLAMYFITTNKLDTSLVNKAGITPLDMALQKGYIDIVNILTP